MNNLTSRNCLLATVRSAGREEALPTPGGVAEARDRNAKVIKGFVSMPIYTG